MSNGIPLRLRDHVPVQSQRDPRITVPQLRLYNGKRRSAVDQFTRYRVTKRMKSGQRYAQFDEQGAQFFLPELIGRIRTTSAIRE